jgi:hypothetical protein
LFVLSVQSALIASPFLVWNHQLTILIAGTLWGFKAVLEFIFLRRVATFLEAPWHGPAFITLQFIYPVYTVIIGVLSNFSSFVWKGRKLSAMVLPASR